MRTLTLVAILLVPTFALCDDKKPEPKGEEVSGKITLDGKPLAGGVIIFASKDGKVTVTGVVAEDGTYKTKLPAGDYRVGVAAPPPPKEKDPKNPPKGPVAPAKYGDPKTSGLTYTLTDRPGAATLDIVLMSK